MEELNRLQYKIRGNVNPTGHPRVYFCCHEDDFSDFFEAISEEILTYAPSAAIWYRSPSENHTYNSSFFADLSQMQLFVVPVTRKFITEDNDARTVEYKYAIDNNIPILPLMQESGMADEFNSICGSIQFLNKNEISQSVTAVPYETKLKNFLDSTLVNDELAERIRAEFDVYVFLSYRKKDREYAQKIMRIIHENEICRDIAIWYDEYLTPGENFNDEITEAMTKSRVFALVVTPSLLETPNYIITTEYPAAKLTGIPILPIEGKKTSYDELKGLYEDIPEVVTQEKTVVQLLSYIQDIDLCENDSDPQHNFLIGLAYLNGIDVEVNRDKAVKLITSAANDGLPEAYVKIVSMYYNGEAVERNVHSAIEWEKKYLHDLRSVEKPSEEQIILTTTELYRLGSMQVEIRDMAGAQDTFEIMISIALDYTSSTEIDLDNATEVTDEMKTYAAISNSLFASYEYLAALEMSKGHLAEAEKRYLAMLEILQGTTTISSMITLSTLYDRLAEIKQKQENYSASEVYASRLMETIENIRKTGEMDIRRPLAYSYVRLAFCSRLLAAQEHPVGIYFVSEDIFTLASYYLEDLYDPELFPREDWQILPDTDDERGRLEE